MERRHFAALGLSAAAVGAFAQLGIAQQRNSAEGKTSEQNSQAASYRECAKACSDCQRECDSCATHCATLMAQGQNRQHYTTLRMCLDCADVCAATAQIVSRSGPFSGDVCEACADVCKRCGEECKQHTGDALMQDCAKACEQCEKACREMVRTAQRDNDKSKR